MFQVDEEFYEDLDEKKIDSILDELRKTGELRPRVGKIFYPEAQQGDETTRPLTINFDRKDSHTLAVYQGTGGYKHLEKALGMEREAVTQEVKSSGLRGRGGAGFPTGVKWTFVPKGIDKPVYLCVNADESEPGTFKDRALLELDPHRVIEGIGIAAYALDCHTVFVYFRGEFNPQIEIFEKAVEEARAAGFVGKGIAGSGFDLEIIAFRGAGAYICGEETALIESLEGKKGFPRLKPPFPAVVGLYGCPTIVNNVETIAALPYIIGRGAQAYRDLGTEKSAGTKLFSVSGPVKRPGVFEVPLGYPLMDLIEKECGGMREGSELKAVIPGGSSVPILTGEQCKTALLDYESLQEHGTMLGSGGVIVIDQHVNMREALTNLARFYAHESCGQCSPCREGTGWIHRILRKVERGEGDQEDLDVALDVARNMRGATICPLADALAMPVVSYYESFPSEFRLADGGDTAS
jgi:NADH-quinone oxidoreductase subunit F